MFDEIGLKVSSFIKDYVTKGTEFLFNLPWWVQAIILLAVAILLLIGLFNFLKKIWKFLLVVAILGAIGFGLWKSGLLDGIISTGATIGLIPYLIQLF